MALFREAERRLAVAGHTDPTERTSILRGIYYGTIWSRDFKVEHSTLRNQGFRLYLAAPVDPIDPESLLDCGLFDALRGSTDIIEHGRRVDIGHLIIGLDSRRSSLSRAAPIPFNGGTGLEICTWLGDLGGGAAMLAVDRVASPSMSALHRFVGSNFGGSFNLEGDVAGYMVAPNPGSMGSPSAPVFPQGGIADALEAYFGLLSAGPAWNGRATTFLTMNGGSWSGSTLSNQAALVDTFSGQIEDFGVNYLVARLHDGKLTGKQVQGAASLIAGAAREVSQVFVDALVRSATGGGAIEARPPAPPVTSPGAPNMRLLAAALAAEVF